MRRSKQATVMTPKMMDMISRVPLDVIEDLRKLNRFSLTTVATIKELAKKRSYAKAILSGGKPTCVSGTLDALDEDYADRLTEKILDKAEKDFNEATRRLANFFDMTTLDAPAKTEASPTEE